MSVQSDSSRAALLWTAAQRVASPDGRDIDNDQVLVDLLVRHTGLERWQVVSAVLHPKSPLRVLSGKPNPFVFWRRGQ